MVEFDLELARCEPEEFVDAVLRADRRRGASSPARTSASDGRARGDLALLGGSASTCVPCRSSRASRRAGSASCCAQERSSAPRGCSAGRRRSRAWSSRRRTRRDARFPDREPAAPTRCCSCPRSGSTRAPREEDRAAISIGTNPHYGGGERRIEAFLLDFEGDLYGQRLVLQLWRRLRDERAFESEEALVAQIARDVDATRPPSRPSDRRFARPGASMRDMERPSSPTRPLPAVPGLRDRLQPAGTRSRRPRPCPIAATSAGSRAKRTRSGRTRRQLTRKFLQVAASAQTWARERRHGSRAEGARVRALPRVRERLREAGRRRNGPRRTRLSGVRVPRLAAVQRRGSTAAAPLRRGSPRRRSA